MLDRLAFNRQAERYRVAIEWARWILDLLAPSAARWPQPKHRHCCST